MSVARDGVSTGREGPERNLHLRAKLTGQSLFSKHFYFSNVPIAAVSTASTSGATLEASGLVS